MAAESGPGRVSPKELIARAVLGMPVGHPEQVTRKPGRAEWRHFTAWLAELWPNDEYTAILAEAPRHDPPPGTQDRR
jgi:hypothetical protein